MSLTAAAVAAPFDDAKLKYDHGDFATAQRLWLRLAEQGDPRAQVALGGLYMSGQGVSQYTEGGLYWYRRAGVQGDDAAEYILGEIYSGGHGFGHDDVQAYMWLSLAAQGAGPSESDRRARALKLRDVLAARMTAPQIAEAEQAVRDWRPDSIAAWPTACDVKFSSPQGGAIEVWSGHEFPGFGVQPTSTFWMPPASNAEMELRLSYLAGRMQDVGSPVAAYVRIKIPAPSPPDGTIVVMASASGAAQSFAAADIQYGSEGDHPIADANILGADAPGPEGVARALIAAGLPGQSLSVTIRRNGKVVRATSFDLSNLDARDALLREAFAKVEAADPKVCSNTPF